MMLSCKVSFAMHNAFEANTGGLYSPFQAFLCFYAYLHTSHYYLSPLPLKKTETVEKKAV